MPVVFRSILAAGALALALPTTALAAKVVKKKDVVEELAPWAVEPDRIKLEVVERLVFEKKQYNAALPLIAAIRKEGLKDPILDLVQGVSMREQGMLSEAEGLLLQARKRMPSDVRVHEALCVLYADQQSLDQAIASCEKATKVDGESAGAWNNLGYLYLVADRPLEAIEACTTAIEINGADARFRNNLALAYVATGKARKALEIFRTTNAEADAQYNVGVAVERYQGPQEALTWYRQALEADSQHPLAADAIDRIETSADSEENEE